MRFHGFMAVANTYTQSDTPLPQVAARAAREAIAAAGPRLRTITRGTARAQAHALTAAQVAARWTLTIAVMASMSAGFAALVGASFH
ncbi:MAG: hypothetical protein JWP97_4607 [Labilithrix sp.]|nr:hypothetical protein [Labilithrix sp.]